MFLLKFLLKKYCFISFIAIIFLNLLTQWANAGDTFLLSKELSDQEGAHHVNRDTECSFYQDESLQEPSMVTASQLWLPSCIKKTTSFVSSKASVLRKLWGETLKVVEALEDDIEAEQNTIELALELTFRNLKFPFQEL